MEVQDWLRMGVLMTSGSKDRTAEQQPCFGDDCSSVSQHCPNQAVTSAFPPPARPPTEQGNSGRGY